MTSIILSFPQLTRQPRKGGAPHTGEDSALKQVTSTTGQQLTLELEVTVPAGFPTTTGDNYPVSTVYYYTDKSLTIV